MKINNKKGIMAFNFIAMIPRIFFLIVAMLACVIMISMFINQNFKTQNVQADILITGMMYGAGGVGYYDSVIGRNYPYIVKLDSLSESNLNTFFAYPNNNLITAEITILDQNEKELKKIYYNKQWWKNWEPLMYSRIKGIGGVKKSEQKFPIIYVDSKNTEKMGVIRFRVLQPK